VSENQPTVSVIIPARDAVESLPLALKAVARQSYPNVEVVVAAADEATANVARAEDVTVVDNPTGTTPAGLNLALAASSGEVIVRCDARSILPPDYVSKAVATLQRTGAANVGGMQVPVGNSAWETAIARAMSSPWGSGDARYRVGGEEGTAETVYLGVFRRTAVDAVGGFDETFVRTQDYELNHRLIESGETVWFDPELKVGYRPRRSLGELARQYFDYGRAKRQFSRKHRGSLRPRQLAAPLLVVALAISLVASIWWPITLVAPILYILASIAVSVNADGGLWRVTAALVTMHISWGVGFLTG
jgi:glycosyltransferase involved in cell wall biosynthesis